MNDADAKIKQQIVDKIKNSTNILVTVSKDPSVDELSAALGLTTLLNKLDKHATAIFSGAIPPAITFLEPDKIFENTADSLRDFIIALDKEKADHLRYKVDGDVVKIFITPYRTTITSEDLEFSQGDFNIELVLALGVASQEHLDTALAAHGRILHDVTVATFSAGDSTSQLGNMDWNDKTASSLCEMVTGISDSLKTDKTLLDKQIATALLTGIVAATDRFSNTRTSSRAMTIAAQLMAAGADQQLIAAKLQESHEIKDLSVNPVSNGIKEPAAMEIPVESDEQSTLPPGKLTISHGDTTPVVVEAIPEIKPEVIPSSQPELDDVPTSTLPPEAPVEESRSNVVNTLPEPASEPSLGGTLSATADQAAEDARRELENQQNKTILSHSYLSGDELVSRAPINSVGQTDDTKMVDIFANNTIPGVASPSPVSTIEPPIIPLGSPTGLSITPPVMQPIVQPPVMDLPLPPPLPDFSTLSPPPLPDFNATPEVGSMAASAPISSDPRQFRIPGQ
jgi:hypothetical protein